KNEYLAKSIASQCFYEFKRQMKYKCERLGIAFVEADRWYPSSKTCSHCGKIKKNLKLSDRVFYCECGFTLDRDLNASVNLANYQI
ncbi:transposase, partial [Enterococcus cecorum]